MPAKEDRSAVDTLGNKPVPGQKVKDEPKPKKSKP